MRWTSSWARKNNNNNMEEEEEEEEEGEEEEEEPDKSNKFPNFVWETINRINMTCMTVVALPPGVTPVLTDPCLLITASTGYIALLYAVFTKRAIITFFNILKNH
jgi:hypothetical protein